jgi:hypothetical protein
MDLKSVATQLPNYVPGNFLVVMNAGRAYQVARLEHVTPTNYHVRKYLKTNGAWADGTVAIRKGDHKLVGLLSPDLLRHFQVPDCPFPLAVVKEDVPAMLPAADREAAPSPTRRQYGELDAAYQHFNVELFQGQLPGALVTLQRKAKAYGYFAPERFASMDMTDVTHEIALNPDHCRDRAPISTLSTLVHEMCHLKRFLTGKPPRGGYHDHAWADMMDAVGLAPISDKGKRVGQNVTHQIVDGGPFQVSAQRLLEAGWVMPYLQTWTEEGKKASAKKRASKTKFTCPDCGANAWGKPDLVIFCGPCNVRMEDQNASADGDDQDQDEAA